MQAQLLAVDLMLELVQALARPGGEHDLLVASGDGVQLASSASTPTGDPSVLVSRREVATMGLAHRDDGRLSVPASAVVLLLVRQRHAQLSAAAGSGHQPSLLGVVPSARSGSPAQEPNALLVPTG